jgi:hypothetical protein
VLAALAVLAAGCRVPRATPTFEFVADYERMTRDYDPLVSLVYAPEDTALSEYEGLVIGDIAVGERWVEDRELVPGYATLFRVVLRNSLTEQTRFDFVTLDAESQDLEQSSDRILRLDGKVTRFDLGSGWLRYFGCLVFLQVGASDLQIEARLTDQQTGKLVMELVDRRRGLYHTPFGPNPQTLRSGFVMRMTVRDTAASLARFLLDAYEGIPATPTSREDEPPKRPDRA